MNNPVECQNLYWFFSASAQVIAALFAFLLAGLAIVQNRMGTTLSKDDTLEDVYDQIQKDLYRNLLFVSLLSGFGIFLCLLFLYLNPYINNCTTNIFIIFILLVIFAGIASVIWFGLWIINPNQNQLAIRKILSQNKYKYGEIKNHPVETSINFEIDDRAIFFNAFVELEITIRSILKKKDLYKPSIDLPLMSYSFKQMIDALVENRIIERSFYNELREINKYRNIIFHGHDVVVSQLMIERTNKARKQAEILLRKITKS